MNSVPKQTLKITARKSSVSQMSGPVKIISKANIDNSPQKLEDRDPSKIVKVTLKRGDSKSKLIKIRKNSTSRSDL